MILLFGQSAHWSSAAPRFSRDVAPDRIQVFEDIQALCRRLDAQLQPGTAILLKGSRGMRLERVITHIKKTRKQATEEPHAV